MAFLANILALEFVLKLFVDFKTFFYCFLIRPFKSVSSFTKIFKFEKLKQNIRIQGVRKVTKNERFK